MTTAYRMAALRTSILSPPASLALSITLLLAMGLLAPAQSRALESEPGNSQARSQKPSADNRSAALKSVGRLRVPAVRYRNGYPERFEERCSATLITHSRTLRESRLIISAWHCIEDYRELSRALVFETAEGLQSEARILTSGGSMDSDWVLLQLRRPLHGAALLLAEDSPAPQSGLLMAGYPRDASIYPQQTASISATQKPRKLEISKSCKVIGQLNDDPRSDCVLRKGASGGAVFSEDLNFSYLGVISQGDQSSQSIFVPLSRFRKRISAYLSAQQIPLP